MLAGRNYIIRVGRRLAVQGNQSFEAGTVAMEDRNYIEKNKIISRLSNFLIRPAQLCQNPVISQLVSQNP